MKITIHDGFSAKAAELIANRANMAAHILAHQVEKDTDPYVPFLKGSLNTRTRVVGNVIIYPGPYARYLYLGVKRVNAATGRGPMHYTDKLGNEIFRFPKGATLRETNEPLNYTKDFHKYAGPHWIERSKAQNLDKWLGVAERIVNNGR